MMASIGAWYPVWGMADIVESKCDGVEVQASAFTAFYPWRAKLL